MTLPKHAFWIFPIALIGTIFIASSNIPATPDFGFQTQDKVIHALAFGLIAVLTQRAAGKSGGSATVSFFIGVISASLYGAGDEIHQSFTPGRAADVLDWVADTLGALLSCTLYKKNFLYYRDILEFDFFRKKTPAKNNTDKK